MRKKLKSVCASYIGLDGALERRMKTVAKRWPDTTGYGFRPRTRKVYWACASESAARVLRAKLRKVKAKGLSVELQ